MTRLVSLLLLLFACGDNVHEGHACIVGSDCPDAGTEVGVDAGVADAVGDACVYRVDAAPDDCCALLPDYAAAAACAAKGVPSTACGELACERADCSFDEIPFCGKR